MRKVLALTVCLVAGVVAGCGSKNQHPSVTLHVRPPQQTGTVKTGTPTGPTNTARTTTSAGTGP